MYMIMQICLQMQPTNNARARKGKKGTPQDINIRKDLEK